jgi:hypothetical protein
LRLWRESILLPGWNDLRHHDRDVLPLIAARA